MLLDFQLFLHTSKNKMLILLLLHSTLIFSRPSQESIKSFREALDKNGGKYQFNNYDGAVHSFTVPEADENGKKFGIGIRYHEPSDKKSWSDMLTLFKQTLGK